MKGSPFGDRPRRASRLERRRNQRRATRRLDFARRIHGAIRALRAFERSTGVATRSVDALVEALHDLGFDEQELESA